MYNVYITPSPYRQFHHDPTKSYHTSTHTAFSTVTPSLEEKVQGIRLIFQMTRLAPK